MPHGRCVGDVGYGDEWGIFGRRVAPEEDVEGGFGGEVGVKEGEVIVEGGSGGGEDGEGCEGFFFDGYEEAALGGGGDEGLECGVQFLGCWEGVSKS